MKRKRVLITAGPTRERIDPVRYISNYSSGVFGYELAKESVRRGLRTVLVSGPVSLEVPKGVRCIKVESARDMRKAALRYYGRSDVVIMAAAVADWRPAREEASKIKKSRQEPVLRLVQNPDILKELGKAKGKRVLIGFALETEALKKNAFKKLREKNLDMIIANRLGRAKNVFGDIPACVTIIDKKSGPVSYKDVTKKRLSKIILDKALNYTI